MHTCRISWGMGTRWTPKSVQDLKFLHAHRGRRSRWQGGFPSLPKKPMNRSPANRRAPTFSTSLSWPKEAADSWISAGSALLSRRKLYGEICLPFNAPWRTHHHTHNSHNTFNCMGPLSGACSARPLSRSLLQPQLEQPQVQLTSLESIKA